MSIYMVEFELPENMTEDFIRRIPEQRDRINYLLSEGKVKSYSLALDRSLLWVVMVAEDERDVYSIIETFPLIEYLHPLISPLAFHNSHEQVMQFSMN